MVSEKKRLKPKVLPDQLQVYVPPYRISESSVTSAVHRP